MCLFVVVVVVNVVVVAVLPLVISKGRKKLVFVTNAKHI